MSPLKTSYTQITLFPFLIELLDGYHKHLDPIKVSHAIPLDNMKTQFIKTGTQHWDR